MKRDSAWTVEKVRALGMTTDVVTAGAILGIGRTTAYRLARTNQFPVPVLRIGKRLVVSVAQLLTRLGAELEPADHRSVAALDDRAGSPTPILDQPRHNGMDTRRPPHQRTHPTGQSAGRPTPTERNPR